MSSAERVAMGLVGVAMVTTMVLPKRQTATVINAFTGLVRGVFATAMGTGKAV